MEKLPTQKELLEAHRAILNEKFRIKYPNGRFCIQYRDDMGLKETGKAYWLIHWEFKRPTSHDRFRSISTSFQGGKITQSDFRNSSFGKCSNYDSIEKLLAACERRNVPDELVLSFERRFHAEHEGIIERFRQREK